MVIQHNCGLALTHSLHDAYSFIKSLQHRGREAAGIAAINEKQIDVLKWIGTVDTVDLGDLHELLQGHTFLAHVRYATRGPKDKLLQDAHPHTIGGTKILQGSHMIIRDCSAVAVHNGQVNKEYLPSVEGSALETTCDTEALLHYYQQHGAGKLLNTIPGAYTLALAQKGSPDVFVLRDKTGIRPGVLGRKDGKYVVASEDSAFRENGVVYVKDLEPGALYRFSSNGGYTEEILEQKCEKYCFFEWNYLAKHESNIHGIPVARIRRRLGELLAEEFHPDDAVLVSYLPRCPEPAAEAYARSLNIPFAHIFYKMRSERSFQGSTASQRRQSIRENLYINDAQAKNIQGKTLVVIDDSIVRGNVITRAGELLAEAGVKKVYMVSYTPPMGVIGDDGIKRGCLFGVDMPPEDTFFVRDRSLFDTMREEKGLDVSVYHLSSQSMFRAFEEAGISRDKLCHFCIGGTYPFQRSA